MLTVQWVWRFIHPGPVVVHLSPVPEGQAIQEYDGSGRWLKIFTLGLEWREDEEPPILWLAHNNQELPPRVSRALP